MKRSLRRVIRLAPSADESEIIGYFSVSVIGVVALESTSSSFKIDTNRGRVDHFGWQGTVPGDQPSFLTVPYLSSTLATQP
jgi:hypothetical protein